MYFQTPLFIPSLKLLLERLEHRYDAPRSLQFAIYFRSGSCFDSLRGAAEHEPVRFDQQSDGKFVVSYRIVFKHVEVSTILVSVESSGSWLHANTCPVFVR